jgi:hypothetical protein
MALPYQESSVGYRFSSRHSSKLGNPIQQRKIIGGEVLGGFEFRDQGATGDLGLNP